MNIPTVEFNTCLDAEATSRLVEDFHREGCALVRGVLAPDECALLRERADAHFPATPTGDRFEKLILRHAAAKDDMIRSLLVREPILGLARAILGDDCRYSESNVIRNGRDEAIDYWHVDLGNVVEFPLPPEVLRHDPRIVVPVQWMTFQIALTDIDSIDDGPTQYVPGSHYSGRLPDTQDNPQFEGHGPVAVLCKAGDMYLTNHQTWHRGSPNRSGKTRYLLQLQYAKSWAVWRFSGEGIDEVTRQMRADETLDCADAGLKELLKKKP